MIKKSINVSEGLHLNFGREKSEGAFWCLFELLQYCTSFIYISVYSENNKSL